MILDKLQKITTVHPVGFFLLIVVVIVGGVWLGINIVVWLGLATFSS